MSLASVPITWFHDVFSQPPCFSLVPYIRSRADSLICKPPVFKSCLQWPPPHSEDKVYQPGCCLLRFYPQSHSGEQTWRRLKTPQLSFCVSEAAHPAHYLVGVITLLGTVPTQFTSVCISEVSLHVSPCPFFLASLNPELPLRILLRCPQSP